MDSRFLDIDRHGAMRIPGVLWVSLLLLSRHWLLLLIVGVSARRSAEATLLLRGGFSWVVLLFELPALALALAGANRVPTAGAVPRFIWRHGRALVAVTVASNLIWTALLLIESAYWTLWPELFLASMSLLDFAILLSVFRDPYYRQLFDDFPPRPTDKAVS